MFDEIYNAALEAHDLNELKQKLNVLKKKHHDSLVALFGNTKFVDTWQPDLDERQNNFPYFTPGGKLAAIGKTDEAERLGELGANRTEILKGYIFANNHDKVEEYRINHGVKVNAIAEYYAKAGNHDKVEEYRSKHHAHIDTIVYGYALAGNHGKVKEYLDKYNADVTKIAYNYAMLGNHDKVEEYRLKYQSLFMQLASDYLAKNNQEKAREYQTKCQSLIDMIASGYAVANNLVKVEKYRTRHKANIDQIALTWARIGDHDKVEEYRTKYHANVSKIALGYAYGEYKNEFRVKQTTTIANDSGRWEIKTEQNKIPPFYQAIRLLEQHSSEKYPKIVETVIASMNRLKTGQNNHWSPYWVNSGYKLKLIIAAIKRLENKDDLNNILEDKNSLLYKALNTSRLTPIVPITLFGGFAVNKAKSLMAAQNAIATNRTVGI